MSEQSKAARKANRDKARRLTDSSGAGKVDASDYVQPTNMKADKKTGMRPVSPRTYKLGGKVQGDRGPRRSDKTPRGNVADEISTRDTKQANRDKFGSPHVGGMKKGGAAHSDVAEDKAMIKKMVKSTAMKRDAKCNGGSMNTGGRAERKEGGSVAGGERPTGDRIPRKDGGSSAEKMVPLTPRQRAIAAEVKAATRPADVDDKRTPRKSGGRTKGKTNINIIVNPNKADNDKPPMPGPVRPPPPPMPPPPPPPMPQGPPPGAPPPNMPPPSMMAGAGGPPPMPRYRGGRLGLNKNGGGGGALGRLEKANLK